MIEIRLTKFLQLEYGNQIFKSMKWKSWYLQPNRTKPCALLNLNYARHTCTTLLVSILSRPSLANSHFVKCIWFLACCFPCLHPHQYTKSHDATHDRLGFIESVTPNIPQTHTDKCCPRHLP